jgi:hypothetical protein
MYVSSVASANPVAQTLLCMFRCWIDQQLQYFLTRSLEKSGITEHHADKHDAERRSVSQRIFRSPGISNFKLDGICLGARKESRTEIPAGWRDSEIDSSVELFFQWRGAPDPPVFLYYPTCHYIRTFSKDSNHV